MPSLKRSRDYTADRATGYAILFSTAEQLPMNRTATLLLAAPRHSEREARMREKSRMVRGYSFGRSSSVFPSLWNNSNQRRVNASASDFEARRSCGVLPQ